MIYAQTNNNTYTQTNSNIFNSEIQINKDAYNTVDKVLTEQKTNKTKLIFIILLCVFIFTAIISIGMIIYAKSQEKEDFTYQIFFIISVILFIILYMLYTYLPDNTTLDYNKLYNLIKNKKI